MSMMGFVRFAAVAAGLVAFSAGLSAQSKVGIVNLQTALQNADEVKDAQAKIEANFKPRTDRLAAMQTDLTKLQQEYDQNQSKYTPAALEELANSIQRKQVQYQRLQQSLQDDFNRDRTDLLTKFGSRMQDVLKKLAEEKGLDMIIDVTNLLYYKPGVEISTEATAAYNKAFPLKK